MTELPEPTEAHIKEACDLLNKLFYGATFLPELDKRNRAVVGCCHFIAQRDTERAEHEAAMQRVSEIVAPIHRALKQSPDGNVNHLADHLLSLILPDPAPTPEQVLAEAIDTALYAASQANGNRDYVLSRDEAAAITTVCHHVAPIKGEG